MVKSTPDLDKMITISSPKSWVTLFSCLLFIVGLFVWLIFGSIPVKVEGRGLFVNDKGVYDVKSMRNGVVQKFDAKPGQVVKEGEMILELYDWQLELDITKAKENISAVTEELENLRKTIHEEAEATRKNISRNLATKEFAIHTQEKTIESLKQQLQIKNHLVEQGLIPLVQAQQLKQQIGDLEITLEENKNQYEQLEVSLKKPYRVDDLKHKEEELAKAVAKERELVASRETTRIKNTHNGVLLGYLVNDNEQVSGGEAVAWFEYAQEGEQATYVIYAFVSIEDGKLIQVGTPVEVEVGGIRTDEYGAMLGKVIEVSPFAALPESLAKTIHNPALIKYLTEKNTAVVQITVQPEKDSTTFSGYRWTSGSGPNFKITTGTVCTIKATVEYVKPLYYVLPLHWLRSGNQTTVPVTASSTLTPGSPP